MTVNFSDETKALNNRLKIDLHYNKPEILSPGKGLNHGSILS